MVFCLVICQILSSAYAMTYSDNGIIYVSGNDETKTLFSQDFENTGASLNGNLS